jgi:hypothetical protein
MRGFFVSATAISTWLFGQLLRSSWLGTIQCPSTRRASCLSRLQNSKVLAGRAASIMHLKKVVD